MGVAQRHARPLVAEWAPNDWQGDAPHMRHRILSTVAESVRARVTGEIKEQDQVRIVPLGESGADFICASLLREPLIAVLEPFTW